MKLDFERFFHVNTNYLCIASMDGFFVKINDAFINFLGYPKDELYKKKFLDLIHPDDVEKTLNEMGRLSEGKTTLLFENRYLLSNGEYVHFLWNSDVDESTQLIYAVASDITKLKEYEIQLKEVNSELEMRVQERTQALENSFKTLELKSKKLEENELKLQTALEEEKEFNKLKSKFVSMASHEFRTPLTSVQSSADLIALHIQNKNFEKVDKHIDRIKQSVQHVHRLLEDFLSVSKLEENKIGIKLEPFDLNKLVKETVGELQKQSKPGQTISIEKNERDNLVQSDRNLIKNVLYNLITNAIKYSEENKTIKIQLSQIESQQKIAVIDEGMGIPKQDQKHLFSRFFRASNTVGIKGTGLGLNIVKSYLDLLDGNISCESVEGEGTTFTFYIPI